MFCGGNAMRKPSHWTVHDLLIAAHACATSATIVTTNAAAEFKRIRGLKVESWLA
jgi:predicted nucleic acid-binding protein